MLLTRRYHAASVVRSWSAMRNYASASEQGQLRHTTLHGEHAEVLGGRMVPFCGWDMPVQYRDLSIIDSHLHTRAHAGLFDVSHMGQLRCANPPNPSPHSPHNHPAPFTPPHGCACVGGCRLHGRDRGEFMEGVVVGDIRGLAPDQARLSLFTNEQGGIKDDTVISSAREGYLYVVVNAGCAEKDLAHIQDHLARFKARGKDISLEVLSPEYSLVALQGTHVPPSSSSCCC